MKLLYFGNERLDAQNLATAVRAIARNGTVSWTSSADRASTWIAANQDVAALVVEARIDGETWHGLLTCVRGLTPRPAVIVVVPEGAAAETGSLVPGADHYVERNSPQFRDLPMVVIRAVAGARASRPALQAAAVPVVEAGPRLVSSAGTAGEGALPADAARSDRTRLVDLERKLADATAALREAEERHVAAIAAADARLAEHQLQYEVAAAGTAARWEVVDEQLRASAMEAESARQNYVLAAAKADRLARRESQLSSQLAAAAAQIDAADAALSQAVGAREDAEARHAAAVAELAERLRESETATESSAAEVKRLVAREADLSSTLADVTASHANLERRLAATEAAFRDAETHAMRERLAVTRKAAAREAELDAQLRQEQEARAADHQSATTEVARLTEREGDLASQLAAVAARLDDVQAARQGVERQLAETIEKATGLEARIQQERAARADLERALADAETARSEAQHQHAAALAAADDTLADHRARFDRELSKTAADRDRLNERVREVEGVLAQAQVDHQSAAGEVARLTQRESDLSAQLAATIGRLADADAARQALERRLADTIEQAIEREAELDSRLRQEQSVRADVEEALAGAQAAWGAAQQEHEAALAAGIQALVEHRARFAQELSQAAAERDRLSGRVGEVEGDLARLAQHEAALTSRLASEAARLEQVEAACQIAERQLAETASALDETNDRARRDRADAAAREGDLEARLTRANEARQSLERLVTESRATAAEAERAFRDETDALRADARAQQARFEAERDRERMEQQRQLTEQQQRNVALGLERDGVQQLLSAAAERSRHLDGEVRETRGQLDELRKSAYADVQRLTIGLAESERQRDVARTEHQTTLDRWSSEQASIASAHRAEIQQLQDRLAATVRDLESTRQRLDVVQADADKMAPLRRELEDSRAESGRLFQQAGLAMFRCSRNGEVTQANRAAMTLVGRRTIDELRGARFAGAVFEDPNGLSWLIERCLSSRTRESIETTWRRKDGSRLFVRLSAYACSPDLIEILAEDLTRLRALQERLGQAQRMEAIGRLASEIAVTCGSLLNDVRQQVHESLVIAGASTASRQQGQQVLAEVTRAAGLLQRLNAYGDEQARTPALSDLNAVIHDLEPVLKRLAGDTVEIQLPVTSSRLNVDVGPERIERLLVNLASYGRARMPFGGQLKIELGTTVVDQRFVAKHPNVRLGPHALITVTETRRSRQMDDRSTSLRGHKPGAPSGSADQKPGLDFGTLHSLVGGCGGHLWMTVQPEGDMVAKIRLPLLAYQEPAPRTLVARGGRVLTRLFQH